MKNRHAKELPWREALPKLYPAMPLPDVLAAAQRFRNKPPVDAHTIYAAACAAARHNHTDYDSRIAAGQTQEEARTATRPAVRAKLREWGGPDRDPG